MDRFFVIVAIADGNRRAATRSLVSKLHECQLAERQSTALCDAFDLLGVLDDAKLGE